MKKIFKETRIQKKKLENEEGKTGHTISSSGIKRRKNYRIILFKFIM